MRLSRHSLLLAIAGIAFTGYALAGAWAASQMPFTADAFSKAQASGKPVLVHVHANWCSVCRAQVPIIGELATQPKYSGMTVLKVDFDSQKADVKRFGAQMQSTLILYKGNTEIGRSVGDTKKDSIRALLDKAI